MRDALANSSPHSIAEVVLLSPQGSGSAGVAGNWVAALRNRLVSSGGKGACRLLTGAASTEVAAVPPYPGVVADTGVDEVRSGHGQRGGCERLGCLGCSAGDRYLGWRGEASETGEGPEREATVSSSHLELCYNMGLIITLASLCLFSLAEASSKAITTSLTTKWFSPPLLLEARALLQHGTYNYTGFPVPVFLSRGQFQSHYNLSDHKVVFSSTAIGSQNPKKEPVYLSGYGVELAIKSTEYKAKDDTQVKGTEMNTTVIGENDPIDEVQGFLFGKLRELHPSLEEQLKEFRKYLVESTNEMAPLKVWQLQDLSFQTAARILAAPVELALVVMKDISQNFPTKARAITKTAVSSQLRTEVEENQKYFKGTIGLQPGDSALFINGLHIDLDTQDIFSLFDMLRNEARVMEGLHRLGIEGLSLHNILKLNIQPSEADYAVDIRSPAISWVNNLEIDSRYNSWPSSLQELLRPTFPGVIRQIRKNLHNMVFIVDPVHETTAELISIAELFLSNHVPLRIGFIFVVNDSEDVDGMQDAGVAVLRAYNYVVQEVDGYHAFQILTHIYNKVRTGEKVKVEHVVSVLEKKYPYVEVNSILGIDSAYDQNRKEARGYYEQIGVGPLPVVLFNGMPFEKEHLDPEELETITMHKILETTSFFQRVVYLGELPHDQDVVEYIMNQPNVVPRINSRILTTKREYLDLTASNNFFVDDFARFSVLDSRGKTAAIANSMNYLTKKDGSLLLASEKAIWMKMAEQEPEERFEFRKDGVQLRVHNVLEKQHS
ncbi:UDP-glucose:glycoprotein glucosyltransferase 1 [Microtus ochrogaster]|uniref:UDP-glucose:glycoprotein glucosyltransferase 1 n=1 Tax=Microtus ochrogaster TaxID=79684 RepID=A0A8J6G4D7_MICOH|nr:UDP-glucose:glycoprotein glucosyltransferase 1 [Microtus ochrogaster]